MTKTNALRLLENAAIAYRMLEYDVSDGYVDAISTAHKLGIPEEQTFKTLVAQAPGPEYFVFVIPGNESLNLKKAAHAAGRKSIEMITVKQLLPLTGYMHGGCSPIGMKKQFPTFIDETAILFETIGVNGGRVGLSIAIAPQTLADFIGAKLVDLV